jgi:hypothetical protein
LPATARPLSFFVLGLIPARPVIEEIDEMRAIR